MPARFTLLLMAGGLSLTLLAGAPSPAAHAAALADLFAKSDEAATTVVDHGAWSELLAAYVKPSPGAVSRLDYAAFKADGRDKLKAYLDRLQAVDVVALNRAEQLAFWANLYNAKTIDIVLDHYPVSSIKRINLGGSLLSSFAGGPWDAEVVTVHGQALSLNDIEHKIMRPIFKDPRIHYAVNCASIGCPNLAGVAFTGAALDGQLEAAARAYVNDPRGCSVSDAGITVSSIYKWYAEDFGGNAKSVLAHLQKYAEPALAQSLAGARSIADYQYDWSLNDSAH